MCAFDDLVRTDASPRRHNEGLFAFLNRSASQYFAHVRELIEEWYGHVPSAARMDIRGALRADDRQMESAFWELFLHEAYFRSGYEIEVHPELPGRSTRPDFLMKRDGKSFYLEAVSVGQDSEQIAQDRRLREVHQILTDLKVRNFKLMLSTYAVGSTPLPTKRLRNELQTWLASLDPNEVNQAVDTAISIGFGALPSFHWEDRDWSLEFRALPIRVEARGDLRSALGIFGPGEARIVDNVTGIRRALDSKKNKYGELEAPLVIALQSNTDIPTRDYEIEQALYGVSPYRPHESPRHLDHLFQDGLWLTKAGWRYGQIPQVVTATELKPWSITKIQPCLWETLEPSILMSVQPAWLARLDLSVEARPLEAKTMAHCLGLPADWPGMAEPDFDLS